MTKVNNQPLAGVIPGQQIGDINNNLAANFATRQLFDENGRVVLAWSSNSPLVTVVALYTSLQGEATSLESLPTLTTNTGVFFVMENGVMHIWRLQAGTNVTNILGGVLIPLDYNPITNQKFFTREI